MQAPVIHPRFAGLIPPLSPAEREQLEKSLVTYGCREPLVVWSGFLLDGHNRLEICTRRGVPMAFVEVDLDDEEAAADWIDANQLGRRNLSTDAAAVLRGRRYNRTKRAHGRPPGKGDTLPPGPTAPVLAAEYKVSSRTIKRDGRKAEAFDRLAAERPEQAAAVLSGDKRLSEVKGEIRRERRAETAQRLNAEPPPLPEGPYRVLVVDPPWPYEKRLEDPTQRGQMPYPSMTIDEIKALPVATLAHEDAVLWLWTTNAHMRQAFEVLDAWGFREKTILTWDKVKMGLGDWLRGQTEHCIMALRGAPTVTLTNQTTLCTEVRREHSRKPEAFYKLVESLCPGSKVELFARSRREGWAAWGAETNMFDGEQT